MIVLSFGLNGSLKTLWNLHRDRVALVEQLRNLDSQVIELRSQLVRAADPGFIEKQAAERLDMVGENDLVFLFTK